MDRNVHPGGRDPSDGGRREGERWGNALRKGPWAHGCGAHTELSGINGTSQALPVARHSTK